MFPSCICCLAKQLSNLLTNFSNHPLRNITSGSAERVDSQSKVQMSKSGCQWTQISLVEKFQARRGEQDHSSHCHITFPRCHITSRPLYLNSRIPQLHITHIGCTLQYLNLTLPELHATSTSRCLNFRSHWLNPTLPQDHITSTSCFLLKTLCQLQPHVASTPHFRLISHYVNFRCPEPHIVSTSYCVMSLTLLRHLSKSHDSNFTTET